MVHVASTDSQDMEDLDAEMEEEMDSAYEEGVNVDVVPGANLSRNTGRRLKRQEESAPQAGGRRGKKEDDGFDQRILQACFPSFFASAQTCRIICCRESVKKGKSREKSLPHCSMVSASIRGQVS